MSECKIGGQEFAAFAGSDVKLWSGLEAARIEHKTLGGGIVRAVLTGLSSNPNVEIEFGAPPLRKFTPSAFQLGVLHSIVMPPPLQAAYDSWIEVKQREKAFQDAVNALYEQMPSGGRGFISHRAIEEVVRKIQAVEELKSWEVNALNQAEAYAALAEHFHRRYLKTDAEWDLVKACAYLRLIGHPDNALSLSASRLMQPQADERSRAALYTVRGAAFHDLHRFDEAQVAVEKSIEIHPSSPHAYYLLGSIQMSIGEDKAGKLLFSAGKKMEESLSDHEAGLKFILKFVGQ